MELSSESSIRLVFFLSISLIIMIWEFVKPKKTLVLSRIQRWPANLAIIVINTILLRLLVPAGAVTFAVWVETKDIGLLNYLGLPLLVKIVFGIVFLDFAIYAQHYYFHRIPILWRLHKVHHADRGFDFTTASRFHPIEILLSVFIKGALIVIFSIPPDAVLIFEIILNGAAIFNHGNIFIPKPIDTILRCIIVTPDMHRVHHSIHGKEMQSNFGFNLSVWDRLFATYVAQPKDGHERMQIGLPNFQRDDVTQKLTWMLKAPFLSIKKGENHVK